MSEDDNIPLDPRELLEEMILAIVQNPDEVKIQEIRDKEEPEKMILQVQVGDDGDRGIVIGRNGFVAHLLRNFMGLVGQRLRQRIEVRIDAGPNHKPKPKKPVNHTNHTNHTNHASQAMIPQGYVMVPASAVVQVPQNFKVGRKNNNFRPRRNYNQEHYED